MRPKWDPSETQSETKKTLKVRPKKHQGILPCICTQKCVLEHLHSTVCTQKCVIKSLCSKVCPRKLESSYSKVCTQKCLLKSECMPRDPRDQNKLEPGDPSVACAVHPTSIAILVIASIAILVIAILVIYLFICAFMYLSMKLSAYLLNSHHQNSNGVIHVLSSSCTYCSNLCYCIV